MCSGDSPWASRVVGERCFDGVPYPEVEEQYSAEGVEEREKGDAPPRLVLAQEALEQDSVVSRKQGA